MQKKHICLCGVETTVMSATLDSRMNEELGYKANFAVTEFEAKVELHNK